jgi:lipopolysaccharide transport system permease protein
VDFTATAALFAILMLVYGISVNSWALVSPLFFLLLLLFTVAVVFLTSSLNVFYRDMNPVVQIGLQLWLYVTPVAYSLDIVPERWRVWFMLNPLTAIVEGVRSTLLFGRAPDWTLAGVAAAMIVALFVVAMVTFKRMDKYFADVI